MATFTAIKNSPDTPEGCDPAARPLRIKKLPARLVGSVSSRPDFPENPGNLVAKRDNWDAEEEEILWHAVKKYGGCTGKAGQKVHEELISRGNTRVETALAAKHQMMKDELKDCWQILHARRGMWWNCTAHVMQARDKIAQETFLKANPGYYTYFSRARKWTTAEMEMPTPPDMMGNPATGNPMTRNSTTYNEEASIYDATSPPFSLPKRKRGRPRKVNQSLSKEPELPAGERPRKRTRESSIDASYQSTNRSSRTLSAPFSTPSRTGSLMPSYLTRDTPQIDVLEVLQNMEQGTELQGMAQAAESELRPFQVLQNMQQGTDLRSIAQAAESASRPLQLTFEDALEEVPQQESVNQGHYPALPSHDAPADEHTRIRKQQVEHQQPPVMQGPNTVHPPHNSPAEEHPAIRDPQQEQQPRRNEGANTAPPRNAPAEVYPQIRKQQREPSQRPLTSGANRAPPSRPQMGEQQQEPLIKGEPGSPDSPIQIPDSPIDPSSSPALEVPDPEADTRNMIFRQIRKDIGNLPDLTREGIAAMFGCFANDEQGYYLLMAMNTEVDIHLMWVRNELRQYCRKLGNNAPMFTSQKAKK